MFYLFTKPGRNAGSPALGKAQVRIHHTYMLVTMWWRFFGSEAGGWGEESHLPLYYALCHREFPQLLLRWPLLPYISRICSSKENLTLHCLLMEREVFFQWTWYTRRHCANIFYFKYQADSGCHSLVSKSWRGPLSHNRGDTCSASNFFHNLGNILKEHKLTPIM